MKKKISIRNRILSFLLAFAMVFEMAYTPLSTYAVESEVDSSESVESESVVESESTKDTEPAEYNVTYNVSGVGDLTIYNPDGTVDFIDESMSEEERTLVYEEGTEITIGAMVYDADHTVSEFSVKVGENEVVKEDISNITYEHEIKLTISDDTEVNVMFGLSSEVGKEEESESESVAESQDSSVDEQSDELLYFIINTSWEDSHAKDRPSAMKINFFKDGEFHYSEYLSSKMPTLTVLVEGTRDGVYTIELEDVDGYVGRAEFVEEGEDGYFYWNVIYRKIETVTISGTKTWEDTGYEDSRPDSVVVNLLQDGVKYASKTVTADNNWEYSFEDVIAYEFCDGDWKEYSYTVQEEPLDDYKTSYVDNTNGVEVVLNSMESGTTVGKVSYLLDGKLYNRLLYINKGLYILDIPSKEFYISYPTSKNINIASIVGKDSVMSSSLDKDSGETKESYDSSVNLVDRLEVNGVYSNSSTTGIPSNGTKSDDAIYVKVNPCESSNIPKEGCCDIVNTVYREDDGYTEPEEKWSIKLNWGDPSENLPDNWSPVYEDESSVSVKAQITVEYRGDGTATFAPKDIVISTQDIKDLLIEKLQYNVTTKISTSALTINSTGDGDWWYNRTYSTGEYKFYNKSTITGSFTSTIQFDITFSKNNSYVARYFKQDYTKDVVANLTVGGKTFTSNTLNYSWQGTKDTYSLEWQEVENLEWGNEILGMIPKENWDDYIFVNVPIEYNLETGSSIYLQEGGHTEFNFPDDFVVGNAIVDEGNLLGAYSGDTFNFESMGSTFGGLVGTWGSRQLIDAFPLAIPRSYLNVNNGIIELKADWYGTYLGETEEELIASDTISLNLNNFDIIYDGELYRQVKDHNPSYQDNAYLFTSSMKNGYGKATLTGNRTLWGIKSSAIYYGVPYNLVIGDDLQYFVYDNNTYRKANEDEVVVSSVSLYKPNSDSDYEVEVYGRKAGAGNYVLLDTVTITNWVTNVDISTDGDRYCDFKVKYLNLEETVTDLTTTVAIYIYDNENLDGKNTITDCYNFSYLQIELINDDGTTSLVPMEYSGITNLDDLEYAIIALDNSKYGKTILRGVDSTPVKDPYYEADISTYSCTFNYDDTKDIFKSTGVYHELVLKNIPESEINLKGDFIYSVTYPDYVKIDMDTLVYSIQETEDVNERVWVTAKEFETKYDVDLSVSEVNNGDGTVTYNFTCDYKDGLDFTWDYRNSYVFNVKHDIFITSDDYYLYKLSGKKVKALDSVETSNSYVINMDNGEDYTYSCSDVTPTLTYPTVSYGSYQSVDIEIAGSSGLYQKSLLTVESESDYSYKLRISSGDTKMADIVMYYNIENYTPDTWKGDFSGYSLDAMKNAGIDVSEFKVYYSSNRSQSQDLSANGWVLSTDWTGDLQDVKSIAFDLDGYVLESNSLLYVEVLMKAPNSDDVADFSETTESQYTVSYVEYDSSDTNLSNPLKITTNLPSNIVSVKGNALAVISGTKSWVGDTEEERPDSITINLLRDGEVWGTTTTDASKNWKYSFERVPVYDEDGNKYIYTVEEEAVDLYTTSYGDGTNGVEVTLSGIYGGYSFAVYYVLDDMVYDLGYYYPDGPTDNYKISIPSKEFYISTASKFFNTLTISSIIGKDVAVGEEEKFSGSFTNVIESIESTGDYYAPSVNNLSAEGGISTLGVEWDMPAIHAIITPESSSTPKEGLYDIINTAVEKTTISGTKTWVGDTEEERPDSITVKLLQSGSEYDSKVVTAEDDWKYSFKAPVYDEDGNKYEYTVEEEAVEGYTTSYASGTNGLEIIIDASYSDAEDCFYAYYVLDGKLYVLDFSYIHETSEGGMIFEIPSKEFYLAYGEFSCDPSYITSIVNKNVSIPDEGHIQGDFKSVDELQENAEFICEMGTMDEDYFGSGVQTMSSDYYDVIHGVMASQSTSSSTPAEGLYDIINTKAETQPLEFTKVDFLTGNAMADVAFSLYKLTCENTDASHNHGKAGSTNCWTKVSSVESDENGKVVFEELVNSKEYGLVEVVPDGYILPNSLYWKVIVNDEGTTFESIYDESEIDDWNEEYGWTGYNFNIQENNEVYSLENMKSLREVKAIKRIKISDINFANGNPTFLFKLSGTDEKGIERTYYKSVEFQEDCLESANSDGYVSLAVDFKNIIAGNYTLSEDIVSRYEFEGISNVVNGAVNGETVQFDLVNNLYGQATYTNKVYESQWFSHNDIVVNNIGN